MRMVGASLQSAMIDEGRKDRAKDPERVVEDHRAVERVDIGVLPDAGQVKRRQGAAVII